MKKQLRSITAPYFEEIIDLEKLHVTSEEYSIFLYALVSDELDSISAKENLAFENGIAIGTFWAASCIKDAFRTRQFIKGIERAIHEKQRDGKTLNIFYAGTGPFASLLLPIILRYPHINYHLLEINSGSLAILKHVFESLEINDSNINFIQGDATTHTFQDNDTLPDIIVSETMQNALEQEQQVLIFDNLSRQVTEDCSFIPENIEIFIGLCDIQAMSTNNSTDKFRTHEKVFALNRDALKAQDWSKCENTGALLFPQKRTTLEQRDDNQQDILFLLTEITCYGSLKITLNQSGLTAPKNIGSLQNDVKKDIMIHSQYTLTPAPTFEIEIIEK